MMASSLGAMIASWSLFAATGLTLLRCAWAFPLPDLNPRAITPQPVITTDFPDPAIIHVGSTWYAFGTQSAFDYTATKVQLATSPDFNTWTVTGKDVLATLPSWANASNPTVWAPDVIQRADGRFVMYFSAVTTIAGQGKYHCVGTAISNAVDGPYLSDSDTPFACPTAKGGAIDASGFRAADGTRYVLYKVDGNAVGNGGVCGNTVAPIAPTPIMLQQVQPDGVTTVGAAVEVLTNGPLDGPDVEAPSMMEAGDGTFVLFFSSQCYSTAGYDVSYATSRSLTGGFAKSALPLFVTGMDGLTGPGGMSVAADGTSVAFHGYASAGDVGGRRAMYVGSIAVSGTTVTA